jgi:hypothetical protein
MESKYTIMAIKVPRGASKYSEMARRWASAIVSRKGSAVIAGMVLAVAHVLNNNQEID